MAVIFDKKHSCFFLYQIYLLVFRTFFKNLKNKSNIYLTVNKILTTSIGYVEFLSREDI